MNKADYQQQSPDSSERLEEKIDKLATELSQIRLALSKLSLLPENLAVEKFSVGQIDFHLANLNIHEVSGALNIGITNGVNLRHAPVGQTQGISKPQTPEITKEIARKTLKNSAPGCNIRFVG